MSRTSRFRYTFITLAVAGALILAVLTTHLDPIQTGLVELARIETRDIDDILVALLLVGIGMGIDAQRNHRRFELESHELQTLKATMRTVQDLVGNALNSLTLFRLEAEPHLSADTLKEFDSIVQETAQKITQLGNLQSVVRKPMAGGTGIQY